MKIPRYIKIAGHKYRIKFPYKFKKKDNLLGQCNINKLEIEIANRDNRGEKLADSVIRQIFIHEILHAINFHYCYNRVNERGITHLGEGLYQVLSDSNFVL